MKSRGQQSRGEVKIAVLSRSNGKLRQEDEEMGSVEESRLGRLSIKPTE